MAKLLLPMPNTPMVDGNNKPTPQWQKWFEGGGAILAGDAKLPISALPDSVINATNSNASAAGRLFMAADGESVSFGGTYGAAPALVVPDLSQLPFLAAGSSYDCKAINLTATGFTAKARIVTLGAAVDHTTGAGSYDNGLGYHTAQKPLTDDAFNHIYIYDFDGDLARVSYWETGANWDAEYSGQFELYAYVSGVWILVDIVEINNIYSTAGFPPSTLPFSNHKHATTITQTIGMVAGAEFGIKATQGAVTAFNEVTYQTKTASSDVSLGSEKIGWRVYA